MKVNHMMRIILTLLCLLVITAPITPAAAQTQSIAVVVNDDAISTSDVNDRLRLIMASAGFPNTEEIKQRLLPQIISSLVEEQLMIQEAQKEKIDLAPEEIEAGLAQLAAQNKMEPAQFKETMRKSGINTATLERQIRSQLSWNKVVQKVFRPQVVISETDVDAFLDRILVNAGKEEFLVSEILLPVPDPSKETQVQKFGQNLVQQVRAQKASFFKLAQQFSKAPGAAQGGDLGWVQGDQLDETIFKTLQAMEKNRVSEPVRSTSGYHILLLREKRIISEETAPPREQVRAILGSQRLDRMQSRLMLDLKSSAFIENRV